MTFRRIAALVGCLGVFAAAPAPSPGQPPPAGVDSAALGEWPLETLHTKTGAVYRGYIRSEGPVEVEIVEVLRPPGKDMYLVVRPVPAADVAATEHLPDEARKQLAERVDALRQRASIEAGAIDAIRLEARNVEGRNEFFYDGPWFELVSTSDEEMTRRAAVKIEQIFRAYRTAFPPRIQPAERLRVLLFGSMEQYRAELRDRKLEIDHPAFFFAGANTILAGADLTSYAERLNRIRAENERIRQEYTAVNAAFPDRKRDLAERLKQNGFTDEQIRDELTVRTKAWDDQFKAMLAKLSEVDRRNADRFQEVSQQLFARLRHEAFHAYVENYLYPQREFVFPRWLNEGLAQVFESARVEGETLRIDAPDPERQKRLRADLADGQPLPLADLLTADEASFLVAHDTQGGSQRHYLYSWGLAWHLTSQGDLLRSGALDKFAAPRTTAASPLELFEQLVGMKLSEFELQWRAAMLATRASSR